MRPERRHERRPGSLATGLLVVAGLVAAALASAGALGLAPSGLLPGQGGLRLAGEFFGRALRPALAFEGGYAGGGPAGVVVQALRAAVRTVVFAAAPVSVSVLLGLVLGFAGSGAWRPGRRAALLTVPVRVLAALMRSVHELIWAVLLLAAFGRDPLVAVIAIAIPYAGTFAKVFAEMLDEAPRDAAAALRRGRGHARCRYSRSGCCPGRCPT